MTIEEAKRILHPNTSREALAEINEKNGYDHEKGIEKVKEACLVACEALDKFKWIPCSERLPKDAEYVLVCTERHGIWIGYHTKRFGWYTQFGAFLCKDVIAWMPFPEPYKAD